MYTGLSNFTNLALALSALWKRNMVEQAAVAGLFNVMTSAKAAERNRGTGSMKLVPEYNGSIEYDEFDELDLSTYTHKHYVKGVRIPVTLIEDEEYNLINQMVQEHAMSFARTRAYHMVSVFNNAFSSTYTGPDGKALCATNHSSGTKPYFNNKGTSALSHDAVVATREAMRGWKDENGHILLLNPDTIIVPVGLEAEADEIVNSVQRSDNANNAINANRRLGYIVEPLLSDSNNWFVVDSLMARTYLKWYDRVAPSFTEDPTSDYNLEMKMRGRMRYSFGWDTHVWVYGHEVA